jgi:hypothetical protein
MKRLFIGTTVSPQEVDVPKMGNSIDFPLDSLPACPSSARIMLKAFFDIVAEGLIDTLEEKGLFKIVEEDNGPRVVE